MTTRITDFNRNQAQLNQIRRQKVQLAQLENQMSAQTKTDSFSEMSKTSGQLLNVQALAKRTNQYIQDIERLDTKLSLMDEAVSGVRKIASNFRTALASSASNSGAANIAEQAASYLDALAPYLNARDGNDYLFSGSRSTTISVTGLSAAKVPSSALALRGALPIDAPANSDSASDPTPGSYIDVRMSQGVYDDTGIEYKMSLRYIKTGVSSWEARITSLTRAGDGASIVYNGKAISLTNSVRVGSSFNADTTLRTEGLIFDPASPPVTIGGANTVFSGSMMPAGATGTSLTINLQGSVDGSPLTRAGMSASATDSQINASPTRLLAINGNLSPRAAVGSAVTHTKTVFDDRGRKFDVDIKLTKIADAGNPSLEARTLTLGNLHIIEEKVRRDPTLMTAPEYAWAFAAGYLNAAGAIDHTRLDADFPPGGSSVPEPIYRIEATAVRNSATGAALTGFPQTLGRLSIPSGGFGTLGGGVPPILTAGGGALGPIIIRQGSITREEAGGLSIRSLDNLPLIGTGLGQQLVQVSGNFSAAAPVNASISNPTPGSYVDIVFKDSEAIVDSSLKAHTLTVRFIKQTAPPPPGAPPPPLVNRWQAYAIGLTQASDNKDSTDPAISPTRPVRMGVAFDPAVDNVLSFAPALKSGASIDVRLPLPAGSLASAPQAQSNTIDLTGTWAAGDRLRVTVNGTEYTAAGTDLLDMAANMRNTLATALGADFAITGAGAQIIIAKRADQAGVPFTLGYDVSNAGASTLGVRLTAFQPNIPGAARAQRELLTITAGGPAAGATFTASINGHTVSYTTPVAGETDTLIRDGLLAALQRNSNITNAVTPIADGPAGIRFAAVTPGAAFTTLAGGAGAAFSIAAADRTSNRVFVQTLTRPENITPPSLRTATSAIHLSGNLSSGAADNAAYDVRLSGSNALIDSNGIPYNATIRFTKIAATPNDRFEARIVDLTHAEGPNIGNRVAGFPPPATPDGIVFGSEVAPTVAATLSPFDAQDRTIRLVANNFNTPGGGSLSFSLPYNKNSFTSHDGPTRIAPQGQSNNESLVENNWSSSLGDRIGDSSYALRANRVMAAHQAQLSARIADDLTIGYGIRADNPGFEKLIRVLVFFKDKSAPPTANDVSAGQALLDEALAAIDDTKANLAMDQVALDDQRKTHRTTANLAKNQEADLIQADQTETAAQLNALKTSIEASYRLLASLREVSLLNYLG